MFGRNTKEKLCIRQDSYYSFFASNKLPKCKYIKSIHGQRFKINSDTGGVNCVEQKSHFHQRGEGELVLNSNWREKLIRREGILELWKVFARTSLILFTSSNETISVISQVKTFRVIVTVLVVPFSQPIKIYFYLY